MPASRSKRPPKPSGSWRRVNIWARSCWWWARQTPLRSSAGRLPSGRPRLDPHLRLMPNREIAGTRDKTELARGMMQLPRSLYHPLFGDRNDRMQYNDSKMSSPIAGLFHRPFRLVPVIYDDHLIDRAEMQIGKHMTGGKGRDQQFFRVITRRVPEKRGVRGDRQFWFVFGG